MKMPENDNTPPATTPNDGNSGSNQQSDSNNDRSGTDNSRSGNNNRGSQNRNRNRVNTYVSNHQKDWKGDSEEIGVVLGIKIEKLNNQTSVDGLIEKLEGHIKRTFEYYEDVLCLVTEGQDPVAKLEAEKNNLITADQRKKIQDGDVFELALMKDTITRYGNRQATLKKNVGKIFETIWGQCTVSIRTLVKGEDEYSNKKKTNDVTWLLEKLRQLTSGVDNEADSADVYFQALYDWTHIRQSENESEDAYQKRVDTATQNLILAGGEDVLYPRKLLPNSVTDRNKPDEDDKKTLIARIRAMHLLCRSDLKRHGSTINELRKAKDVGQDEWPQSQPSAFKLLVKRSNLLSNSGSNNTNRISNNTRNNRNRFNRTGAQFLQRIPPDATCPPVAGSNGRTFPDRLCWNCNRYGHIAPFCPEDNSNGTYAYNFSQHIMNILNKWWILIDTCSTCCVTNNPALLTSIQNCNKQDELNVITNGGSMRYNQMGKMKLLPLELHYNEQSLATILSFKAIVSMPGVHVSYDNLVEDAFHVILPNQFVLKFQPCENGLYYIDSTKLNISQPIKHANINLLSTVAQNKSFWTQKEIKGANDAREMQEALAWPGTNTFKHYIKNNLITNTSITTDDITRAELIAGPAEPILAGKMTRLPPITHKIERIPLPFPIAKHHKKVQIHVDFFYINKVPFLFSISDKLKYRTATPTTTTPKGNKSTTSMIHIFTDIINRYNSRGFDVEVIHGDNEFDVKALHQKLSPTHLQIYGTNEHVGHAENGIKHVKERTRSVCHSVPYRKYTKIMVTNLIEYVISNMNDFPSKNSISDTMSPATIVEGVSKPDFKYKRVCFGSYALVWVRTTNDMTRRAIPCIALRQSNRQGGHYFMSLYSGRRIHSYHWESLPISDDVIQQVEEMATEESQPTMHDKQPIFEWQPGLPISTGDYDDTTEITNDTSDEDESNDTIYNNVPIVEDVDSVDENENELEDESTDNERTDDIAVISDDDEDISHVTDEEEEIFEHEHPFVSDDSNISYDDSLSEPLDLSSSPRVESSTDEDVENVVPEDDIEDTQTIHSGISFDDDDITSAEGATPEPTVTSNEGADTTNTTQNPPNRPQRSNAGRIDRLQVTHGGKSYSTLPNHQFLSFKQRALQHIISNENNTINQQTLLHKAINIIFTMKQEGPKPSPQMSAYKGIKEYGELAVAAMVKEFNQLVHGAFPGKPVVEAIDSSELTEEDKKTALDAVNLIKVKKNGVVKGRTCANGSKEKYFLPENDSIASPTGSLEAIISTLLIDIYEDRDVAIFDIPGAYLHAKMPEEHRVMLKLKGRFVDIMCTVNEDFKRHILYENGVKVLYLRVLRAIYGCIRSALLWYNLYSETLVKEGYKINPYDRCVANKLINGRQCTLVWYVDDNKISHVDPEVVTEEMKMISEHFGKLTISRGNKHQFLGMDIELDRNNKEVIVSMIDQVEEAINMMDEDLRSDIHTPAYRDLFDTYDETSQQLDKNKSERFHSITAKLLFIAKRARPDIETAVSYLTTRVSKSNVRDWYKLIRVLSFLKTYKNDKRRIGAKSLKDLFTYIDASYAIHPNMRGHTGGLMSFGTGIIHGRSGKQKLNVKSSTECEIVGVSEYYPFNIWQTMFLEEQGYPMKNNILFQDNQSAIKMERNGRNSCTGNSRHVNIRYFFIKDRVDNGEVVIEHCPTQQMVADFFTKPLTGKLFHTFRDIIMGYKPLESLDNQSFSIKERVRIVSEKGKNLSKKGETNIKPLSYADVVKGKKGKQMNSVEKHMSKAH